MIKATGTSADGRRKFTILGLSELNLTKLREGKPIHIFGAEIGSDRDIIIFWGETEDAMAAELEKGFGAMRTEVVKQ